MVAQLEARTRPSRHTVRFYATDRELTQAVREHLAGALEAGGSALIIATPEHRSAFERGLATADIDVAAARQDGTLVALDAAETLTAFMREGRPDPPAFEAVIGGLVRRLNAEGRRPSAFGEMVALLWEEGNVAGALELEELWNGLQEVEPFSLLCGYPASIIGAATVDALQQVCSMHSDVSGLALIPPAAVENRTRRAFSWEPSSARDARHFTARTLEAWGLGALVEDAVVLVGELVSNVVLHARTDFSLVISADDRAVRIAVEDGSRALPRIDPGSAVTATTGRGLRLIDAIARRWGTEPRDDGKVVWVELGSGSRA